MDSSFFPKTCCVKIVCLNRVNIIFEVLILGHNGFGNTTVNNPVLKRTFSKEPYTKGSLDSLIL